MPCGRGGRLRRDRERQCGYGKQKCDCGSDKVRKFTSHLCLLTVSRVMCQTAPEGEAGRAAWAGAAGAWVVEGLRRPVSRLPSDISFVLAAGGLFGIDYPRL